MAAHLKSFTTAPTSSGNTRICATNWIFPQSFGLREIAEGKSDAYSHDEQLQRIHFLAAYLCLDHTHTHIYTHCPLPMHLSCSSAHSPPSYVRITTHSPLSYVLKLPLSGKRAGRDDRVGIETDLRAVRARVVVRVRRCRCRHVCCRFWVLIRLVP